MKRLMALIKREYWENKGAFRTTPLIIGGIYIVVFLMGIFTFGYFDNEFHTLKEALRALIEHTDTSQRAFGVEMGLMFNSFFFSLVLAFVVFFYLLGSLYDDRKDRSILWWKSLPTSDTLTLASKLLSAMFVVPLMSTVTKSSLMIVPTAWPSPIVTPVGNITALRFTKNVSSGSTVRSWLSRTVTVWVRGSPGLNVNSRLLTLL